MDDGGRPPPNLSTGIYTNSQNVSGHIRRGLRRIFIVDPSAQMYQLTRFYLILHKMPAIAALIASIDHKSVKEMYEDFPDSHVIPLSSPNNSLHSFYTFLQVST